MKDVVTIAALAGAALSALSLLPELVRHRRQQQ